MVYTIESHTHFLHCITVFRYSHTSQPFFDIAVSVYLTVIITIITLSNIIYINALVMMTGATTRASGGTHYFHS